jgi:hypothetical protein
VKGEFLLDSPNWEVREIVEHLIVEKTFETETKAFVSSQRFLEALSRRDPAGVVQGINSLLSNIYEHCEEAKKLKLPEGVYHASLVSYFHGLGLDFQQQVHTSLGRSDLVIRFLTKTKSLVNWVIELNVCRKGQVDKIRAQEAIDLIINNRYAAWLEDPVILGIAINDQEKTIKAWKSQGGIQTENESDSELEAKPKVTKSGRKPKAKGGKT